MEGVMRIRRRREQKRRLVIVCAVMLILVFLLGLTFGGILARAKEGSPSDNLHKYYANIEIQSGDTLWELAGKYSDDAHYASREAYIEEVLRINSLESQDCIISGQYLIVPYYAGFQELDL